MSVRDLAISVGAQLGRAAKDVQPFLQMLEENWYDDVQSLVEASPEDLTALGMPRRFAVELTAAAGAAGGRGGGGGGKAPKGKGKSKESHEERYQSKGKGKSKGKDWEDRPAKSKGKGKARGDFTHKIPIDLSELETDFKFRPKLVGNKGANIFHIQDQTGASVELQGTDEEGYMEFVLSAKDEDGIDRASKMCEDLVSTVFDEFEQYSGGGGGKSKGKGKKGDTKGKGKGKTKSKYPKRGDFEARIPISTEGIDPEFHFRAKLVGEGGRNVKHIESATKAHVSVEHDDAEGGLAFSIAANDQAAVDAATEMCEDLLSTVLEEAGVSKRRVRPEGASSAGGKKGAGKGKRKGKATDDEERPRKAPRTD